MPKLAPKRFGPAPAWRSDPAPPRARDAETEPEGPRRREGDSPGDHGPPPPSRLPPGPPVSSCSSALMDAGCPDAAVQTTRTTPHALEVDDPCADVVLTVVVAPVDDQLERPAVEILGVFGDRNRLSLVARDTGQRGRFEFQTVFQGGCREGWWESTGRSPPQVCRSAVQTTGTTSLISASVCPFRSITSAPLKLPWRIVRRCGVGIQVSFTTVSNAFIIESKPAYVSGGLFSFTLGSM